MLHRSEIRINPADNGLARKQTTFEERFPARASPTLKVLAANVRRIRLERGLSQQKLASLIEVDQRAISVIENSRSNPTVAMLDAIAEALESDGDRIDRSLDCVPREKAISRCGFPSRSGPRRSMCFRGDTDED